MELLKDILINRKTFFILIKAMLIYPVDVNGKSHVKHEGTKKNEEGSELTTRYH